MAWQDHLDTVQKLYVAYYQRPAEPQGLRYWAQVIEDYGIDSAVKWFVNSSEAQSLYQGDIEAVIKAVYNSAFGRDPETDGLNYWKEVYEKGWADTGTIVWAIVNGAKGVDAIVLENKLESANNFTKAIDPDLDGIGPFNAKYSGDPDAEAAREFLKDVDASTVKTESQAESFIYEKIADEGDPIKSETPTEGQTLTLTNGVDTLYGTDHNDVFIGDNSNFFTPAVQVSDTIYGQDGTDTLKLYGFTGANAIIPQLNSVEVVDIVGGARNVNIANRAGVEKLIFEAAPVSSVVNITVGSNQTVDFVNVNATAPINIKSDVSITQNDIIVEGLNSTSTLNIANAKVATVNIEAKGTGNAFGLRVAGATTGTTATVNISGTGSVDITNVSIPSAKIVFDASNNSGGVTIEIGAPTRIPLKIIGGEGTDGVEITAAGNYTFNKDNMLQNVEKVELTLTATGVTKVDLSNQSEGFTITGSKFNDTIYGGKGADTITTGKGSDNVVFKSFNTADKITDFTSTKDDLYLDIGLKGTVNNPLPNAVYAGTNSVRVMRTNANGAKVAVNGAFAGAVALNSKAFISASNLSKIKTAITGKTGGAAASTGIMFGYSKSAGKLYLLVVKDLGAGTAGKLSVVEGYTKTIATLGANTTLAAGDIHIF